MAITKIQGQIEKENNIYYEVDSDVQPLGEGGMGKVYPGVCVDEISVVRKDVAIKFLYDDLDEQTLGHARREASIQLHNDNLIEMFGFSETEDVNILGEKIKHYHIASELLDGITLADLLEGKTEKMDGHENPFAIELYEQFKSHPYEFATNIVRNVLSGLMALHDAGYIHRDIDPSNIMLTTDGKIKIIDFGIAKKMNDLGSRDRALTVSGVFMGKPEYAAPELVLGDVRHQNRTTDIYAVGILYYQCIIGHVPFQGPHAEVLDMQLKKNLPLSNIRNQKVKAIIAKATAKKQSNRYQSIAEFRAAVDSLPKSLGPENSSFGILLWVSAVVLGLGLGALLGYFL